MAAATRLIGQHQAACTKQQQQPQQLLLLPCHHKQPPAGYLVSQQNTHVAPAAAGEVQPLRLGRTLELQVPLIAAPMAGITAAPLRLMYTQAGASMAVSEMVIAATLQAGNAASRHLASWHPQEGIRSVQLYGVRPQTLDWAVKHLVQECGVHHIDLNFGCPVRKVTAKGGGSALPLRPRLFRRLVAAAAAAAGPEVPVTVKLRMGLGPELMTFLQAGVAAADAGAAGLVLHARTADQQYSPPAHWEAVQQLVQAVPGLPVIGNGDVFEAADAVQLMRQTGCHGVMIGRAALGRPWLFEEAAAMLAGQWPDRPPPNLGHVLRLALQHVTAWADWEQDELGAVLKMRKLIPCYLAGFSSARQLQRRLFAATSLADWHAAAADPEACGFDPSEPYPVQALRVARLKGAGLVRGGAAQKVVLPPGWLEEGSDEDDDSLLECLDEASCEG
ncbi:hypothetical protein OEZ86_007882 [Tetradesmus obliquus]|nr:hypothetical protein OEZ86_007882 [Tetradesmus obliquus]